MTPLRRGSVLPVLLVAGALALTACDLPETLGASPSTVLVTDVVTTVTESAPAQGGVLPEQDQPSMAAPPGGASADGDRPGSGGPELAAAVAAISGSAGVTVVPVGGGAEAVSAGAWRSGVAWSTIKIPLAVAVEQSGNGALEGATSAITSSDNDAAQRLWDSLGGGAMSASKVSAVLAEAGDGATMVPSTVTRPPYSVFGQTQWSLEGQARFGSRLPCLRSSGRVVDLMGQVSSDQTWGLGRLPGARFKGGWGPGEGGGYLVRQFGIVPGAGGDLAVAIAVEGPTFEAGTSALSELAESIGPTLAAMPGGTC